MRTRLFTRILISTLLFLAIMAVISCKTCNCPAYSGKGVSSETGREVKS